MSPLNCAPMKTKTPTWCKTFGHSSYMSRIIADFVLKFPSFRYRGNKGRSQNDLYVEAMFQIWWRSVHKWRHSVVYSRRRPDIRDQRPETGDWTRQVILYSVQCCYALHWTDNNYDDIYSVVIIAEPLREFTRFTRWIGLGLQKGINPMNVGLPVKFEVRSFTRSRDNRGYLKL